MDDKLLLVKSISLLYRESQLSDQNRNSRSLVTEIIDSIKVADSAMELEHNIQAVKALKGTVIYMLEQPASYTYEKESMLQRIKLNIAGEEYLYDLLEELFERPLDNEQIAAFCKETRDELFGHQSKESVKNIIKEASAAVLFNEDKVDWSTFVSDLMNRCTPFTNGIGKKEISGIVNEVDFDNVDCLKENIETGINNVSPEGIMRTGWQGVNRMMGEQGGFKRGDFYLIGALKHNFKSGMLMNLPKQVAIYNKPYMLDETKKPLIIYISLENNLDGNILGMYKNLKENELGVKCSIEGVDPLEAAKYIKKRVMEVNGYHFKMLRFDPSEFTYRDLFELLDGYEHQGYEIHMLSIDYLNMMTKRGCEGSNSAEIIRDLFRRVRNYCNPKLITLLTAHQLSADAVNLRRQGGDNFVKEVADKSYYDGSKAISHEADFEMAICLEEPGDGYVYLEMQRGKHRGLVQQTPLADKFTVYRFEEIGDIPEDVGGPDKSRKRTGSATTVSDSGGGGDAPWWSSSISESEIQQAA